MKPKLIFSKTILKNALCAVMLLSAGLTLICSLHSCKNTNNELVILYDKEFDEVKHLAQETNKVFCIILARPNCPPCQKYIQNLSERYNRLASKVMFNIVDVSLPENQWYMHWLCTGGSPTTCIFSPEGELKATVFGGVRTNAMQCVEACISGDTKCAEYFYSKLYPATDNAMLLLNTLLSCKQNLEKGQNISPVIDTCLNQSEHPYALYMKSLNENLQGRHEEAVYQGKQFLSTLHANRYYSLIYSNLIGIIKPIIDPNYTSAGDGALSVVEELALGGCKLRQARPFSLTLTNAGQSPLSIHDIVPGCTCVKLAGTNKSYTLQPGQSQNVDFIFTADVQGEIFREISFFSDGVNPIEHVRITATVQ